MGTVFSENKKGREFNRLRFDKKGPPAIRRPLKVWCYAKGCAGCGAPLASWEVGPSGGLFGQGLERVLGADGDLARLLFLGHLAYQVHVQQAVYQVGAHHLDVVGANLEILSIEALKAYIGELEAEIARTGEAIALKEKARTGADSVFKS